MEISPWHHMDGRVDSLVFWCYTCDPRGERLTAVDLEEANPYDALYVLRKMAIKHAKEN